MNISSLSLGERLRFYREKANLMQKELAEKVNIHPAYISFYELESRKDPLKVIPLIKIAEIAKVLHISLSDLVTKEEMRSVDFGRKLKFYRELQRLTQEELAERMSMTVDQINQYEITANLSNQMIQKFADALNIPSYFLSSSDTINNTEVECMSFGERIRFYRLEQGMSQKALAEKAGIVSVTISKYESGMIMEINFVNVIRIASALNKSCKDLIEFEENIDDISSLPFCMKMKYYREMKNMSQDDLAEKLGMSRNTISAYESGVHDPSIGKISCIADALEIPMGALINEEKDISELPFGQKLRYYREIAPITQEELASKSGIASTTVSSYELGILVPNVILISKFAEIIGIPPKLLTDSEEIPNNLFNFMD